MVDQADVGFALIARDASKTLGACLDSLRPFVRQIVVGVDETTTDDTAEVAKAHGADVVEPVVVSEWHECAAHGRVLAQHFARARNASFKLLDPGLAWYGWIDADDVLHGGEHLPAVLAGAPEDSCGLWLPYVYASSNNYTAVNTVFDRERLLRTHAGPTRIDWTWEYRVHECVKPLNAPVRWARDERVQVRHQEGIHKSENSAKRNLLLLEIDLEEEGETPRTVFYIANQYFAMNDMPGAIRWYERLTELPNPAHYEYWQTCVYLSIAYERHGDLDNATRAAFMAIDANPDHPEPYWRLATIYCLAGEWAKCVKWDRVARGKHPAPSFVFTNPMDGAYNSKTALADAYARLGHVPEALEALEQANAVSPNPNLERTIAHYRRVIRDERVAQAFVDLATGMSDEKIVALYADLSPDVKGFGRTRDLAVPAMLRLRDRRFAGVELGPLRVRTTGHGLDGTLEAVVPVN